MSDTKYKIYFIKTKRTASAVLFSIKPLFRDLIQISNIS